MPPDGDDVVIDLAARVERDRAKLAAQGGDSLIRSSKGELKPCEHNARTLIAGEARFDGLHYDEFLSRMRIGDRDWTDADDLEVLCWLQQAHGVAGFTPGQARNGARAVAYARRRDSLREFVESLPAWDGIPRIELAFTDAWGAPDNALTRAASRNLFIAMVARALRPGAQVDTVWSFEGEQGKGKSRALRALGGEFHAEITAPIGTPDFMREQRGLWLAELSELDSLRGREAPTIKRLLSAPSDRFVQKYAIHAETYPRRAVAVATTNESEYWQDPTGARRLVPVTCTTIRVDLIEANRLQWFAEALSLFRAGASWWEFPPSIADAQDGRHAADPWEDVLRRFIAEGRRTGIDSQGREPWPDGWISTAVIMRDWLRIEPAQQGRPSGVRLAHVMRRLGFIPRPNSRKTERGWVRADTDGAGDE